MSSILFWFKKVSSSINLTFEKWFLWFHKLFRFHQKIINIIKKSWTSNSDFFDVKQDGFQTLTIPVTAEYKIEIVAPGNSSLDHPGVRIIGKFELKKGRKITAALGQQGDSKYGYCGSGGSFLVLESDEGPKPLLIAGGAGCAWTDWKVFGRGNCTQVENVGSSGKQRFFDGDKENIYCAGAGFYEAPRVSNLADGCVAPKSYKDGLTGGKGNLWLGFLSGYSSESVTEGGFGGGGGSYSRKVDGKLKCYQGAGGGFTGGSTGFRRKDPFCLGLRGQSFSADSGAKFDYPYVRYGYCKIQKIWLLTITENKIDSLSSTLFDY